MPVILEMKKIKLLYYSLCSVPHFGTLTIQVHEQNKSCP